MKFFPLAHDHTKDAQPRVCAKCGKPATHYKAEGPVTDASGFLCWSCAVEDSHANPVGGPNEKLLKAMQAGAEKHAQEFGKKVEP